MDCRALSSSLMELLRLETLPVAVRLYTTAGELPQKPLPFKMNICQLISLARHQGRAAGGVTESMVCSIGAACTGLIETPEDFRDGTAAVDRYVESAEVGKEFFANTFKLGDQGRAFEAILLAPLSGACDLQPDVVLVYGNPAQIMRLIHGCVFRSGRKVAADTVAEAAVCSAIGFVKATGRPIVGFPCAGDRRFGGTQNSELVFAAPFGMLEEIVTSLQALSKAGPLYPVAPNVMWTPRMPAAYTITEGDLEGGERR
jgi:uncharacterized protein (DUF169 family)